MGADHSVNLNIPQNFNQFSLMFCSNNKIRLLLAPVPIVNATKALLNKSWPVNKVIEKQGFIEFQLGGSPLNGSEKSENDFKYLICMILRDYYSRGWHYQVSTQLQRRRCKSSTIIFEKCFPVSTYIMAVSLHSNDRIRIAGPNDCINFIKTMIVAYWPYGLQCERQIGKFWEFKLKDNPWSSY